MQTINELKVEKDNLRYALQELLDEYRQYVDNACHCEEYEYDNSDNEVEQLCLYCYAKHVLK